MDIKEILHLYIGCKAVTIKSTYENPELGIFDNYQLSAQDDAVKITNRNGYYLMSENECVLLLRPLSDLTDAELTHIGKMICAIPNHESKEFVWDIERASNACGIKYRSPHYASANWFQIYNEKDKSVGHIECGWYDRNGIRRTKELWVRASFHLVTVYLLKLGFDLFGLISTGQAFNLNVANLNLALGRCILHK